jgi:2-polyprenyl-3-methyl-5-hydroxy-6-metoxy-1,4-benzoquinol methylase
MECIICNKKKMKIAQEFKTYKVLECDECKFGIVDPIPTPSELEILYNSVQYYDSHMNYNFETISQEEIRNNIFLNKKLHFANIQKYMKPELRFLEIGCGGGFALKAFEESGLEVAGVETSGVASEFASKVLKLPVENCSFEDFNPKKKFDIIMLNHVLEHFLDPNQAMKKLASLLDRGGILYIRVPDHDSFDRKFYKEKWPAYAHYHISNFSEKSLQLLFLKNGLSVIEVKKYISEIIPKTIRSLLLKLPGRRFFSQKLNGRTITIIGKLKER